MFWGMAGFINQLLGFSLPGIISYTCWKDPSLKFSQEFYIKGTLFLSSKTFSVIIIIFYWLLTIKEM